MNLSIRFQFFITCGYEKSKDTLFVYHAETGDFLHKILLKYPNFKEVAMVVALPDKPWQVALIDLGWQTHLASNDYRQLSCHSI